MTHNTHTTPNTGRGVRSCNSTPPTPPPLDKAQMNFPVDMAMIAIAALQQQRVFISTQDRHTHHPPCLVCLRTHRTENARKTNQITHITAAIVAHTLFSHFPSDVPLKPFLPLSSSSAPSLSLSLWSLPVRAVQDMHQIWNQIGW